MGHLGERNASMCQLERSCTGPFAHIATSRYMCSHAGGRKRPKNSEKCSRVRRGCTSEVLPSPTASNLPPLRASWSSIDGGSSGFLPESVVSQLEQLVLDT